MNFIIQYSPNIAMGRLEICKPTVTCRLDVSYKRCTEICYKYKTYKEYTSYLCSCKYLVENVESSCTAPFLEHSPTHRALHQPKFTDLERVTADGF